jgi:hypothetical protein
MIRNKKTLYHITFKLFFAIFDQKLQENKEGLELNDTYQHVVQADVNLLGE